MSEIRVLLCILTRFRIFQSGATTLLEVGCGVGNFMFPLLVEDEEKRYFFHAVDVSDVAVKLVKVSMLKT